MPYVSEKMRLSGLQDRRRRLTDEQKADIRKAYATGNTSYRALASQYHVDKSTIGYIVSEDRAEKMRQYNKEHWRDHQEDREAHAKTIREHRRYKHNLYVSGKLAHE